MLRTTIGQKRHHIELVGYPTVTLAQAREKVSNAEGFKISVLVDSFIFIS